MWNEPPLFFDDENEQELLDEFVKMSALYPLRDKFDIAAYVFRNQRDPSLRSAQAAIVWEKNLEVKERIRNYTAEQAEKSAELTEPQLLAKILAVTENETLTASDKKVRLEGYYKYAEVKGMLKKAIEIDDKREGIGAPRQIVFGQYE